MKTTPEVLKGFLSVLNRKELNDEIYNSLLRRWGFTDINLEEEMTKIEAKKSNLSKSRRDSVPLFLKMKKIISENEAEAAASMTMTEEKPMAADQITL